MAFDAGSVVAKIQAQVDNFKAGLESVKQELDKTQTKAKDFAKSMKAAGEKVTKVGKNLSLKVTAPIVAAGTAAVKFAADLEDAIGATDQIFGSASRSMQDWADNLESYYGIAEAEALTYANTMGSMLQNIGGLTEAEAAKQSQTLLQLAGDLTAMFGGTTEDAVRALTGALKGNNTMLDNYGMAVNEAMIKTKALEMGLIREGEELSLAAKQSATLALIMEQTGAAQGQAAREADGASGTIRSLLTVLKDVSAEIGQVLLPIITPLIAKVRDWVQKFSDLSPAAKKIFVVVAGIVAAIGPLIVVIGTVISSVGAVAGAIGAVSAPVIAVIAVIGALVAALVLAYRNSETFRDFVNKAFTKVKETAVVVFEGIKVAVSSAIEWISAFWAEHGETIIAAVVAYFELIMGVVTSAVGFIQDKIALIQAFWDEHGEMIMEAVRNVWNFVAGIIEWVMPYVLSIIQAVWNTIQGVFSGAIDVIMGIVQFFSALFTGNWSELWESVKQIFSGVWDIIKSLFGGAIDVLKDLLQAGFDYIVSLAKRDWEKFKDTFLTVFDWVVGLKDRFLEWGANLIDGLIDGVTSKAKAAVDAVKDVGKKISDGVKNFFGINSPSTLFAGFGENMGEGLAKGIEATKALVSRAADQMAVAATPSFAGAEAINMPTNGNFDSSTTNNVPINFYVYGNANQDNLNQIEKSAYNGVTKAVQRRRIRSGRL